MSRFHPRFPQVIFPAGTVSRKNDLYLFCCSAGHKVAPQGRYLAFVSTTVEEEVDGLTPEQVGGRIVPWFHLV
jgi:RAB protein geranylgeranyltransferase component A